jgi:hypothetical protein
MTARVVNGWVVVPCDAPDLSTVEIALVGGGRTNACQWKPAFRDWVDGTRVAQVRTLPPSGTWTVWVRVDGRTVTKHTLRV